MQAFAVLLLLAQEKKAPDDVRLVLQNAHATLDLKDTGVANRAICIGGSALRAGKSGSDPDEKKAIEEFLAAKDDDIRRQLQAYLKKNSIDAATTDWIVLDMEHPVHPSDLGSSEHDANRDALIEAFKRRIAIAREALPKAKLSLYGTIVGDSRGLVENAGFQAAMKGCRRAADLGMFDRLDYLVPVIYQRWGPQDRNYRTLEEYTRQTVKMSATLNRSDGSSVPLAPLLSVRVFNKNSAHDRKAVSPDSAKLQLKVLAEFKEVAMVGFWSGQEKPDDVNLVEFLKKLELK